MVALMLLTLVSQPVAAEVTPEELEAARSKLIEVREQVQALTDRYEAALSEKDRLDASVTALTQRAEDLTAQVEASRMALRGRAADMYMDALSSRMTVVLSSSDIGDLGTSLEYLEDVATADQKLLVDMGILEVDLDRSLAELEATVASQEAAISDLDAAGQELNEILDAVQAEYNEIFAEWQKQEAARIAAEEARRKAAAERAAAASGGSGGGAPPVVTGGRTCPVNGFTSFSDTWGASRSGGRAHKGVDMLAARDTSLVAIESGVISRMRNGGLGGITVWLNGNSGDSFYYAHLNSWASGLNEGQSVSAGQAIGTVGTSGNAPANVPHLHFEFHPGGGSAVNPTPLVRQLCG